MHSDIADGDLCFAAFKAQLLLENQILHLRPPWFHAALSYGRGEGNDRAAQALGLPPLWGGHPEQGCSCSATSSSSCRRARHGTRAQWGADRTKGGMCHLLLVLYKPCEVQSSNAMREVGCASHEHETTLASRPVNYSKISYYEYILFVIMSTYYSCCSLLSAISLLVS